MSSSVKKSLIINQHNTFELLRSILPISTEMVQFLSPELEYTLNDLEIHRRPNAASFR